MRTTLQWVSTLGGVLTLIFFGLDRFKAVHVPPKVIVGLLRFTFVAAVGFAITEKPKPEPATFSVQVGRDANAPIIQGPVENPTVAGSIGETPELKRARVEESRAALRDELAGNLQQLAAFIQFTAAQPTGRTTIPRRPGETREQFEDRARDEFAHDIESPRTRRRSATRPCGPMRQWTRSAIASSCAGMACAPC